VRIAVCHPQTPFARGGAEMHTESLTRALREAGHEADILSIPFKWYPPAELVHQMAMWRSLDLSEAHGQTVDMVIALRFPSYLVPHEHKVVWLIHQHRTAYELWDHPAFGDISHHDEGEAVRELIHRADRIALGEALAPTAIFGFLVSTVGVTALLRGHAASVLVGEPEHAFEVANVSEDLPLLLLLGSSDAEQPNLAP
jgi:hypothetical protein